MSSSVRLTAMPLCEELRLWEAYWLGHPMLMKWHATTAARHTKDASVLAFATVPSALVSLSPGSLRSACSAMLQLTGMRTTGSSGEACGGAQSPNLALRPALLFAAVQEVAPIVSFQFSPVDRVATIWFGRGVDAHGALRDAVTKHLESASGLRHLWSMVPSSGARSEVDEMILFPDALRLQGTAIRMMRSKFPNYLNYLQELFLVFGACRVEELAAPMGVPHNSAPAVLVRFAGARDVASGEHVAQSRREHAINDDNDGEPAAPPGVVRRAYASEDARCALVALQPYFAVDWCLLLTFHGARPSDVGVDDRRSSSVTASSRLMSSPSASTAGCDQIVSTEAHEQRRRSDASSSRSQQPGGPFQGTSMGEETHGHRRSEGQDDHASLPQPADASVRIGDCAAPSSVHRGAARPRYVPQPIPAEHRNAMPAERCYAAEDDGGATEMRPSFPTVVYPTHCCPVDGNCLSLNDPAHQALFLHRCTLPRPCAYEQDPRHGPYFIH